LEDEMVAMAEAKLAAPGRDGSLCLFVWTHSHDTIRQEVLQQRGYTRFDGPESTEYQRSRLFSLPIPDEPLAEGYAMRALGDINELPSRSWASWRAFHPDLPDEDYKGWDWYLNLQQIPLYRRDLDMVVIAPDGQVAAFCTVWYDDVTRTGYFEPVGTVPEHQRKGLGKAVMREGMRRLKRMGAVQATVAGYSVAANALYSSVMSWDYELLEPWVKRGL
jgi:GNAT superfamily N-acetyltransferase